LPCPAHFETSVASEASDTLSHQTLWSRAKRATPLLLLSTGIAFLSIKFHCCCCFVSLFYYYFIIILATCCCCCGAGATVTGVSLMCVSNSLKMGLEFFYLLAKLAGFFGGIFIFYLKKVQAIK